MGVRFEGLACLPPGASLVNLLSLLLFLLPIYMLFRLGRIKANWVVLLVFGLIEGGFSAAAILLQRSWIFFAGGSVLLVFFELFYDDEPFCISSSGYCPP